VGLVGGAVLAVGLAAGYVLFRRWKNRPVDDPVEPEPQSAESAPVVVEPSPVPAAPIAESLAVIDPEPAPTFEDDESERPLLGTQLLEDRPGGPSSARTLYDRSQEQQTSGMARRFEIEEAETLATPVQWKSDRNTGDDNTGDDNTGDDAAADFFDDVVERDGGDEGPANGA
jgi:hypothetical protein